MAAMLLKLYYPCQGLIHAYKHVRIFDLFLSGLFTTIFVPSRAVKDDFLRGRPLLCWLPFMTEIITLISLLCSASQGGKMEDTAVL